MDSISTTVGTFSLILLSDLPRFTSCASILSHCSQDTASGRTKDVVTGRKRPFLASCMITSAVSCLSHLQTHSA